MKHNICENFTSAYPLPQIDDGARRRTIKMAENILIKKTRYTDSKISFVWMQLKNLSKTFWAIQLICFALFLGNISSVKALDDIQALFLTIVPIMTFYVLPELLKAQIYNSSETEAVCLHSPAKVIAVKMALMAVGNILIISIASIAFGYLHRLSIAELLCRGFIPFNLSLTLSVVTFDFVKINSNYAMLSVSSVLAVVLIQMRNIAYLLADAWLGIFLFSTLLAMLTMLITVLHMKKVREGYYGA